MVYPSEEDFEELRGADNRTLTDLYNHLQYLGVYRLQCKRYNSGVLSVDPDTTVSLLSVSGIGIFICQSYCRAEGIPADASRFDVKADGNYFFSYELGTFPSPNIISLMGWSSTGYHSDGIFACRVVEWDTTNDIYRVNGYKQPTIPYRFSLDSEFKNLTATSTATIQQLIHYLLFVSSRQALLAISKFINARTVKKLLDKRVSAVEVHTVGQSEKEEEIPYSEFLEAEKEHHLSELARRKPLTYVIVTYPDNVELEKVLGSLKPKKILHDNILE
ncbi:MAG: hypothetical protein DRO09_02880 [Thermoprotei archaeon]|nr:MAG: hypothetical protein DRO09_02880 [Thermoprotei archaeon]